MRRVYDGTAAPSATPERQLVTDGEYGRRATRHYYAADGKLRATKRYARENPDQYGLYQTKDDLVTEIRYDALGRRISQHTRHQPQCSADCNNAIERYIWDGAQLLYELRANGTSSLDTQQGSGKHYGRVGYVHGPAIDAPLAVMRSHHTIGTYLVVPHTDHRGQYLRGTRLTGADCTDSTCGAIQWPAARTRALFDGISRPTGDWIGSLVHDQRDQSGLLHRRNRYYDPTTGQFTQMDPIGIAGGLNVYGFAGGDPINFSDPFGLSPCPPDCGISDAADLGASFVPGVSTVHDAAVLFRGENLITGESEGFGGRLAAGIGLITPAGGGQIRAAGKALSATGHFVHQAINRGVKPGAILDAMRNPLRVNPVKVDDLGRPSQSIVGRGATVVQNPETGALITTHPTSSRLRDRLLREP